MYHSTSIKQRADVEFKSLERKTISVDNTLSLQPFLQSTVHVLVSFYMQYCSFLMVFINLRNALQRPRQFLKVVTVSYSDFFQQYIVYHGFCRYIIVIRKVHPIRS